jgi:hypothetical protein
LKKGFTQILLLVLLIIVSSAFAYYYGTQKKDQDAQENVQENDSLVSPTSINTPVSTPKSNLPTSWTTYTNQEFGFAISYPPSYKALTDQQNLYGWPNGIVLIYNGGQSYDLVIEHWDTQDEYENKYKNQSNITVKKIGNSYITMLNANFENEIDQIIDTFEIINSN